MSGCCDPGSPARGGRCEPGGACVGPAPPAPVQPCCPSPGHDGYGYEPAPYVVGETPTFAGPVPVVSTELTAADRRGARRVRWNVGRGDYLVRPGLYAAGSPDDTSPVLVSANYKLSFDSLRTELGGIDAWILVIDTRGVNVWCAAGKGTFGTAEIVARVRSTALAQVVSHNTLVLPQLGAPGVAAHEVRAGCGFRVVYGPVRASDIPEFLEAGMNATHAMRRITFATRERAALVPIELSVLWRPWVLAALTAALLAGSVGSWGFSIGAGATRAAGLAAAALLGVLAGAVLTPVLLPWLPGRMFSAKGAILGVATAAVALAALRADALTAVWVLAGASALASFAAMNFTGSTTFTSLSGVLVEMRRSLPWQVAGGAVALVAWIASAFVGVGA